MIVLTGDHLRKLMPRCQSPDLWAEALRDAMRVEEIDLNKERACRFLAQIAVESAELTRLEENLNYSADRLMAVWPNRFPTRAVAEKYAHRPHALANYVYANRMGNGDEASGDGWRFRGRGPKMLTGKDNYVAAAEAFGSDELVKCPDQLLTKKFGALVAAWFWGSRSLNQLADDTPDDDQDSDYVTITRRVNGGLIGLDRRIQYLRKAEAVFA